MFKLNLKIALRNLWKNRGYTLINVLGLTIGMASCILIFIFIRFQLSFDKGYKNSDQIYRVVSQWKYNSFEDYSSGVPIPVSATVRNEFAGVGKVAAIVKNGGVITVKDTQGKQTIKTDRTYYCAEPSFFEIFDIPWIGGNHGAGLAEPNTVVLSESTAKEFFGSAENAVGKSFLLGTKTNLKVIGVFKDMPENSSFPLKIVLSYQNFWAKDNKSWDSVSSGIQCYVQLENGLKGTDIQATLKKFNKTYLESRKLEGNQVIDLQPLGDIHFDQRYGSFADTSITLKEVYGLGIIGLFLMVTACINFINLATAQAINRSKEVGVRKVMGSKRKQLVVQFLTETFAITLMALLLACVIAELVIPSMENLYKPGVDFSLFDHPMIFVFMFTLVLFVGFLAGLYPAMVMSGFNPALAIKNKATVNAGNFSLRKVLVVVQFTITIILIIGTLVIIEQMSYVRQKPLGFDTEAIVMINAPADSLNKIKREGFKQRVLKIPGVKQLSYCIRQPLSNDMNTTNFSLDGIRNKDFEVRLSPVDRNYFDVFDLKIIAGKLYAESDTINGFVVNETFLKSVHLSDPQLAIGKIVEEDNKKAPIVGVVKDFNDRSLKEKISPMLMFSREEQYYRAAIKIDNKQIIPAMKEIEALWNSTFPTAVYYSAFVNEDIKNYYETERIMGVLFKVFAGVIIFISFIGLFGLISFVATQRTKEVAIRKVLGASTVELVKMLNGSFLFMVFLANLVAWPLAYLLVSKWLSGFAYRIEISAWPFLFAMVISMLITFVTVSIRSYKAAVANTIDALKYE
jgi:putative ABC transport system permease protein